MRAPSYETILGALEQEAGASVSREAREALVRFAEELERWASRINLVGARHRESRSEIAFLDALVLTSTALIRAGERLVDVGAGAGVPTIPLLLLRPDLSAVLVEPRRKRVAFLRTMIATFDLLERARVIEARLEALPESERFDLAISRATFAPPEWLRRGLLLAPAVLVLTSERNAVGPLPNGVELRAQRAYKTHARTDRLALRYER